MAVRIEPSILSADFTALADAVARVPSADLVHVDVMDNHFVPNLTFGLPMVQRLTEVTDAASAQLDGALQLWPHRHGTDAMFLALLRRW